MPGTTDPLMFGDRFLFGNFAPVTDETTARDLHVDGVLPHALSGRYLRIGPNPIGAGPPAYSWESTDSMVHAVTLHAGRAPFYRNRWIDTCATSAKLGAEPAPASRTGLVVLDAADIAGPVVANVRLPRRIPYGLRGLWIPGPEA